MVLNSQLAGHHALPDGHGGDDPAVHPSQGHCVLQPDGLRQGCAGGVRVEAGARRRVPAAEEGHAALCVPRIRRPAPLSMAAITQVFACLGLLSPTSCGALMICALVLFLCLGTPAGYVSAGVYKNYSLNNNNFWLFCLPSSEADFENVFKARHTHYGDPC